MKARKTLAALTSLFAATSLLSALAADSAPPASGETSKADTVLRQMSEKLGAARAFSFKARREITPAHLAGGDGLHGTAKIAVTVQRPDKMAASATLPGDVRRFYFDGSQLCLVDVKKNLYSTVPLAASLDQLPAELARIYGFTPPLAEFVLSDLYHDVLWRAQSVSYLGTGTITTGFLGLKRVHCHRLALTGQHADSELWIAERDLLPRRWTSRLKGAAGNIDIRIDLSDWNLNAKTNDKDFVFSPGDDALEIPMMTEAEMAGARNAAK